MRLSSENRRRIVVWLLLAVIMTGATLHRSARYRERPLYDTASDIGLFSTEEAFQYRYTRMVARDEAIPLFDKKAQWPEGIIPFRELTLFQEYLHGTAFRLLSVFPGHVSLHVFLIYFVCFLSSLTVPALFFGARILGAGEWAALFCSALYAFTGAAFARVQFYELEITAFPLMALSFAACLRALRRPGQTMTFAVISGCLLAAALCSWHFTRFYLLIFWTAMAGAFLFTGGNRGRLAVAGVILLLTGAVGVLSPVMRSSGLLFSPAMLAGALVVAGLYYDARQGLHFLPRLALLAVGAVLIVVVLSFGAEADAYGHVWGLFKYKIINLLVKPANPADLPFEGRIIWNGPFNSPSIRFLICRYGLLLPLALAALFRFVRQQRHSAAFEDIMVIFMAILFLSSNIMVQRLTIFGAFFLGLAVVYLFVPRPEKSSKAMIVRRIASFFPDGFRLSWIFLGACLVFQIREAMLWDQAFLPGVTRRLFPAHSPARVTPYTGDEMDLLVWIRENTPEDAVFLSNQGNSPAILTYTGRAINLHPKLETREFRNKYKKALFTLFGDDEEALYALFDDFQTDYYVYPVCNLLQADADGERYLAGISRLSRGSLIYRLHFEPDGFRRLRLVYRNRYSQVYRVLDDNADKADDGGYVAPYFPVYDPGLFDKSMARSNGYFDDARVDAVLDRVDYSIRMMNRAEGRLFRGDRRMTLELMQQALTHGLPDGEVYGRAAENMIRLDNPEQALVYARRALAYDPANLQFKKLLARVHVIRNEPEQAQAILTAIIREGCEEAVVYNNMGVVLWKRKQFAVARENFLKALTLDPDFVNARHNLEVLKRSRQP